MTGGMGGFVLASRAARLGALALLVVAAWACPSSRAPDPVARPNLVLIIGDDHGYPYFGFMGDALVKTPNLDRLAREGTVFVNGYVTASKCLPTLRTLLTGELAFRPKGAPRPQGRKPGMKETLPALLGEHGYASFQAGKFWEPSAVKAGFTEGTKSEPLEGSIPEQWMGGRAGLAVGRMTMQPVFDFIDRHASTPFFLWFAPMLPHKPWNAPAEYTARYAAVAAELGPAKLAYYANVARCDDAVGELVDYLDEKGLRSRTLIVYLSDNGYDPAKERDGAGKSTMFELGFRTPLVFNWPGHVPAGVRRDDLVSALDLYPTLLDYGGVTMPPGRPGIDLRPAVEQGTPVGRSELIGYMAGVRPHFEGKDAPPAAGTDAYFLRDSRWHYVWYPTLGDDQLYDLADDPNEQHNVLAQHPERSRKFRRTIEAWWKDLK